MSAPHGHPGTHTSARARRWRGREPIGGRVRTRRKAVIPLEKRLARPMEKARGANAAGCPLYVRAGRGCDRARARLAAVLSSLSHLLAPPPPCVCLCVCLCAVCGLLDVSPRDRRLCVLPGWRMNVNVNGRPRLWHARGGTGGAHEGSRARGVASWRSGTILAQPASPVQLPSLWTIYPVYDLFAPSRYGHLLDDIFQRRHWSS